MQLSQLHILINLQKRLKQFEETLATSPEDLTALEVSSYLFLLSNLLDGICFARLKK